MKKIEKYFEKRIAEDKKRFAEEMEYTKEHCSEVYEKVQALKGEAEEIMKNEGLSAALRFIVDNIKS